MLVELVVENYAVVERVRMRLHAGLNLLTGETGSGKSLVVGALGLLFGGRASAEVVRSGAERARIAGIFEAPEGGAFADLVEDGELLVEREVLASGKSRAFVGSRPATVGVLRELAPLLGDIHGQHDQQRLFAADAQIEMVDAYAGNGDLVEKVAGVFGEWQGVGRQLAELEKSEQERLRLSDLWAFQRKEIEETTPEAGEDAALEAEKRVLGNVARLEENTNAAFQALYEAGDSALAQIRQAWRSIDEICEVDPSLEAIRDSLKPVEIAVEEAAHELRHYLGRLEANPARLEAVENRLASLDKLKRKYGATVEQVLAFLEEVRANIEAMESSEERKAELKAERERLGKLYEAAAGRLTASRVEAARKLEKRLEAELQSLAMERTRFVIERSAADWSAQGADRLRFLVSPNPGEEPRPLDKVASGGELSRIALALKTAIAGKARPSGVPRTLVFDEVDAGVGGSAAETVGRRLKQLAGASQVLCVTHLPQIAGFADHHYSVAKRATKGRTVAVVDELSAEERTREIGRMLSGQELTDEALLHAEKLLRMAAR